MKSTFRARRLASSEVISQVLFTSEQAKKKQNGFCRYIVTDKVTLWAASYWACVVILKQLFTSVLVKVVYTYLHFGDIFTGKLPTSYISGVHSKVLRSFKSITLNCFLLNKAKEKQVEKHTFLWKNVFQRSPNTVIDFQEMKNRDYYWLFIYKDNIEIKARPHQNRHAIYKLQTFNRETPYSIVLKMPGKIKSLKNSTLNCSTEKWWLKQGFPSTVQNQTCSAYYTKNPTQ